MNVNAENWHERMTADRHIQELGVKLAEASPGYAKTVMIINEKHLNGMGVTHGGVVFSLADYAFAAAANAERKPSVAATVSISFLKTTQKGDKLTATCTVDKQGSRVGFYDVKIIDQKGSLIATAKGTSCVV
ncbi:MAG: PaaI family thioesterase [Clostridia bacterium]|jgi:acyl-CoA thioesterase|nr:PaaI family thioesterase [Clostridia bacterium]